MINIIKPLILSLEGLKLLTLCYVGYIILLVIYRLTFHPLAQYPGPFFSKISEWSIPWQCITRDRHVISLEEHQRYGPIVRIGPNTLSFSSPGSLHRIYQPGREYNPLRKASYYDTINAPAGAHSLHSETSRTRHAAHRRMLDYAFTSSAIRTNEPYINDAIDDLCNVVAPEDGKEWSSPRDMNDHMAWFAYDVMGSLVFGRKFDCLTETTHRYMPRLLVRGGSLGYILGNFPHQWVVRRLFASPWLMSMFGGEIAQDEYKFVTYSHKCMTERLDQEDAEKQSLKRPVGKADKRDMMHYIIHGQKTESSNSYNRKKLNADSTLLIAAGSDTTSASLAALLFYLTLPTSSSILEKLTTEIRNPSRFLNLDSFTGTSTATLPYLRACIDESLRLAPPAPVHLPRTVVEKPGIEIDGHLIPAGVKVGASAYVLHHDENAFPDPWTFNPDRWMHDRTDEKAAQISKAKAAFIPFSLGSRGCIGKELAYREMCLCAARLLYQFDIRRAASDMQDSKPDQIRSGIKVRKSEYQLYDCFMVEREGPQIEFRQREGARLIRGPVEPESERKPSSGRTRIMQANWRTMTA